MATLRVGIVGYGVMGRAHAYAYRTAPLVRPGAMVFVPTVMSGRDQARVADVARAMGIGDTEVDWRRLIERDDVDVVDICTPPGTHAAIAEAAAAHGRSVICEKPLAVTYAQAVTARDAVVAARVRHAVGFNYRRLPAVSLMRRMIANGDLGDIRMWRGTWLSDEFVDSAIPFDWRFEAAMGGTTIADLGSHLIDMAMWMLGSITEVVGQSSTFVTARPSDGGARPVEVDDASSALVRFASGAHGTFEVARSAPRRPCDFTVEVNGSRGTAFFSYARLNELWLGSVDDPAEHYGLTRIRVEHSLHPETEGWWPIGQGVGYDATLVNQVADLAAAGPDRPWAPDFTIGAEVVRVCAAIERSVAERRWVAVSEVVA